MKKILFLGGDKRITYAARAVSEYCSVSAEGLDESFPAPSGKYGYIVLPLPATRDGVNITAPLSKEKLPLTLIEKYASDGACVFVGGKAPAIETICRENRLILTDYFSDETLTLKNAQLTAEAAAVLLSQSTEGSLYAGSAVITGSGRVAGLTARLLKAFGCRVTICARDPAARAKAELTGFEAKDLTALAGLCENAGFIINTVPAHIFSEECFSSMKRGAVFMELATLPPEPCAGYAKKYDIRYIHASGLPGKYSPKTAGELIADKILLALRD